VIKKRAMAKSKGVSVPYSFTIVKRLDTGYADNQPNWPYWVCPCGYDSHEWTNMHQWVQDTLGNGDWMTEHGRWVGSDRRYWFREDLDRTMFILKWS